MSTKENISQLSLERLLNNECTAEEEQALLSKIKLDGSLSQRYEALKDSNQEILNRYPSKDTTKDILERFEKRQRQDARHNSTAYFPRWAMVLPVVIVSVLLISVLPIDPWEQRNVDNIENGIRFKGLSPKLLIFRKKIQEIEQLHDGGLVRQGDIIQLRYISAGRGYGVIFSVDGGGSVTLHFPVDKEESTSLGTGTEVTLDYAYELDDAPKYERFFFVTSDKPIDVERILEMANEYVEEKQAGKLGGLTNMDVASIILEKSQR